MVDALDLELNFDPGDYDVALRVVDVEKRLKNIAVLRSSSAWHVEKRRILKELVWGNRPPSYPTRVLLIDTDGRYEYEAVWVVEKPHRDMDDLYEAMGCLRPPEDTMPYGADLPWTESDY
jgi:hypothetical protein